MVRNGVSYENNRNHCRIQPFPQRTCLPDCRVKTKNNADFVVIAMSGDFVQRGAPAIIDKYCRAEMALLCGADLVIELPAVWAVSSAEGLPWQVLPCLIKWAVSTGYALEQNPTSSPCLRALPVFLQKNRTFTDLRFLLI